MFVGGNDIFAAEPIIWNFDVISRSNNFIQFFQMFTVFPSRFIRIKEIIGKSGEIPALSRNCESVISGKVRRPAVNKT